MVLCLNESRIIGQGEESASAHAVAHAQKGLPVTPPFAHRQRTGHGPKRRGAPSSKFCGPICQQWDEDHPEGVRKVWYVPVRVGRGGEAQDWRDSEFPSWKSADAAIKRAIAMGCGPPVDPWRRRPRTGRSCRHQFGLRPWRVGVLRGEPQSATLRRRRGPTRP